MNSGGGAEPDEPRLGAGDPAPEDATDEAPEFVSEDEPLAVASGDVRLAIGFGFRADALPPATEAEREPPDLDAFECGSLTPPFSKPATHAHRIDQC